MDEEMIVESGVENEHAADVQTEEASQTVTTDTEKQNNYEKAFAKRLSAEREKWQTEVSERYAGYEDHKFLSDYLQETNGMDVMTLKEQIEMARLQERAEQEGISPDLQKRLEYLEQRDQQASEMERQHQEAEQQRQQQEEMNNFYTKFKTDLESYAKDKGIDPAAFESFMMENRIGNMDIAYKAMRHDELASKLESAEKDGMKRLISAKGSIPTVTGSTAQGTVSSPAPKTFAEARARAMQRF